jgi:hypothetical protein
MTELSFLIELLLNHKLAKATKDAIAERIKEVETRSTASAPGPRTPSAAAFVEMASHPAQYLPPEIAKQAPSMQRIMLRHLEQGTAPVSTEGTPIHADATVAGPAPVAVVAQTPAAAAAMASRAQAISQAISGKREQGQTRPRKF